MGDKSKIEWTDATWNTVYGCTKVSPACANCYIERTPPYRTQGLRFDGGEIPVRLLWDRLDPEWKGNPLRWTKPRRIFVNSLSDTFHEDVPFEFIDKMFGIMLSAGRRHGHIFQVLTKRPERMREYVTKVWPGAQMGEQFAFTFRNVWLGVTVENQAMAEQRIPVLLDTPAAVRYISAEPLLGPLRLHRWLNLEDCSGCTDPRSEGTHQAETRQHPGTKLDWVIVGGESAGPEHRSLVERCSCMTQTEEVRKVAREGGMRCGCSWTGWRPKPGMFVRVRDIQRQCESARVPFLFKQWGGPKPTSAGRELDGRTWDEFPR